MSTATEQMPDELTMLLAMVNDTLRALRVVVCLSRMGIVTDATVESLKSDLVEADLLTRDEVEAFVASLAA